MELEFGSGVNVFVSCSYWIRIVFVLSMPEPAMVITHHDYLFSGASETHVNMSMHVNTSTHINPCKHTPTHVNTCQHMSTHVNTPQAPEKRMWESYYCIMLYHVISCSPVSCYISWSVKGTVMFFNSLAKVIVTIIGQSQVQALRQHHDRLKDVWPRLSSEGVKVSSDRIAQDISRHSWMIYEWSC